MDLETVQERVDAAVAALVETDRYLLEVDLSERCIAARLALYLQGVFPSHSVDVEYNRQGRIPKALGLDDDCANSHQHGEARVIPDVIVHQRGEDGPNLLVVELKKTSNRDGLDCDRQRLRAFREQLNYQYGALIELETRHGHTAAATVVEWIS